jgi:hypothetical protein
MVLSAINIGANYKSVLVIDEIYLNNQRTHILFESILKDLPDSEIDVNELEILSAEKVNSMEIFTVPNPLNPNRCEFI